MPLIGEFGLLMGSAQDVLNRNSDGRRIDILFQRENDQISVALEVPADDGSLVLDIVELLDERPLEDRVSAYLSAERLGPRDVLEVSALSSEQLNVGHQGQYTAQVLVEKDREIVAQRRRIPEIAGGNLLPSTLGTQAEAWLSRIVRAIQVEANRVPGTSLTTLRFREPSIAAEWVRPSNVGFGFSYALPIIVAGLSVAEGSILIVENPEAHLHPAGQSQMGEFLTRVASAGVQVIVESHSDHVLNGIRRAIATEHIIDASKVQLYFYGENAAVNQIDMTDTGGLSSWPEKFFDQIEEDLISISRGKSGSA